MQDEGYFISAGEIAQSFLRSLLRKLIECHAEGADDHVCKIVAGAQLVKAARARGEVRDAEGVDREVHHFCTMLGRADGRNGFIDAMDPSNLTIDDYAALLHFFEGL